jgi:hypothetical protein
MWSEDVYLSDYSYVSIIHKDRVVSQLSVACWSDCVLRYDSQFLRKLWTVAVRISVRKGIYALAVYFIITEEPVLKEKNGKKYLWARQILVSLEWRQGLLYLFVLRHFSYGEQIEFKKIK